MRNPFKDCCTTERTAQLACDAMEAAREHLANSQRFHHSATDEEVHEATVAIDALWYAAMENKDKRMGK